MLGSRPLFRQVIGFVAASSALLSFGAPITASADATLRDLLSTLDMHPSMTTFHELVKTHPEIFPVFPNGGVTILAPNNFAFGKVNDWGSYGPGLQAATLQYHVIPRLLPTSSIMPGESVIVDTQLVDPAFVNVTGGQRLIVTKADTVVFTSGHATRGTVVVEDLIFDNGIIHIIDSVMKVPDSLEATSSAYKDLESFVGASYKAGLMSEISETKDLTLYIPTTDAFRTVQDYVDKAPLNQLQAILKYHVTPGIVFPSWELRNGTAVPTLVSEIVGITLDGNNRYINSAKVVQDNVIIANGFVHIVDAVLNPAKPFLRPDLTSDKQEAAFELTDPSLMPSEAGIPFATNIPNATPSTESPETSPTFYKGVSGPSTSTNDAAVMGDSGITMFKTGIVAMMAGMVIGF
ncbi:hypothetical protein OQA88_7905 [Cercophora sp. LCS_1]